MLIGNSLTEEDRVTLLARLMNDARAVLDARMRIHYCEDSEDYNKVVDTQLKEAFYIVAKEYVEHYELKPIS